MKKLLFLLSIALLWASCQKEGLPKGNIRFERPPHFPEPTYTFGENPVTEEGFNLGKRLFGDPQPAQCDRKPAGNGRKNGPGGLETQSP